MLIPFIIGSYNIKSEIRITSAIFCNFCDVSMNEREKLIMKKDQSGKIATRHKYKQRICVDDKEDMI